MIADPKTYYHLSFEPAVRVVPRPLQIISVRDGAAVPRRAVRTIQEGGLVAYPTDTVYGLGCDMFNQAAVRRIYEAKQRPLEQGLPVLIGDIEQLGRLVEEIPAAAGALMDRFWPGALTLLFPRSRRVPLMLTGGTEAIGVRLPNHPIPRALSREAGVPIVGTSANVHGDISPVTAQHVVFSLGDKVDIILNGGPTSLGRESTVVDMTQDPPRVIREGAIPRARVEEVWR